MLPIGAALAVPSPSGVVGSRVRSVVGAFLIGSALSDIESSGIFVYTGCHQPPARCSVLWPLLTPLPVSRLGPPQVRARCVPAQPPHLPPRLDPRLRCVVPTRRIVAGLDMRFLFVGPPVSASLPPPARLPSRSWLHVVVLSHFHVLVLLQGTCTPFTTRPCWAHTHIGGYLSLARQNPQCERSPETRVFL